MSTKYAGQRISESPFAWFRITSRQAGSELLNGIRGEVGGSATGGRVALFWVGLHCDPAPLTPQGRRWRQLR